MRKALMTATALALVTGAAMSARPRTAGAQGGGTIEADVKYNGAPVVEKLKVNKDTEKCGTEATIEKVVVGGNKGLGQRGRLGAGRQGRHQGQGGRSTSTAASSCPTWW